MTGLVGCVKAAILASLALTLSPAVRAQSATSFSEWTVGQPRTENKRWSVGPNDQRFIAESALRPTVLGRVDADIHNPAGGLMLASGSQLFGLGSLEAREFCTVRSLDQAHTKYLCLIDKQADGMFDGYRVARTSVAGFPVLTPAQASDSVIPASVPYTRLDPKEFAADFKYSLVHIGRRRMSRRDASFQRLVVGERGLWLGPIEPIFFDAIPSEYAFDGITLRNFSIDGKRLQFDVTGAFHQGQIALGCCRSGFEWGF